MYNHSLRGRTSPRSANRPDWLPASAKILFVSQWQDGFLPDSTYKLKDSVTKTEFVEITKHLDRTPHTKERKYTDDLVWLQWTSDSEKRWDPSAAIDTTFVHQEGDFWQLAKYENGFLYYQSLNH